MAVLRFIVFFALVVGAMAFVAVPVLASPVLTQMVRDAGLRGDDLHVSIGFFDPSLLAGRADQLRVEGRNVRLGPATAGGVDLTFRRVGLLDRTFEAVNGNLRDVELVAGGLRMTVARVEVNGPASSATVSGHFTPQQSAEMVRQAAEKAGVALSDVRLVDGGIRVNVGSIETQAAISVEGGGLVLRPQVGPAVLLISPAPPDPWRLTEAWASPDGITVRGTVNAATLAEHAIGRP